MHICIAGPAATDDLRSVLSGDVSSFPIGTAGAPLIGVLARNLLNKGHTVSVVTLSGDLKPSCGMVVRKCERLNIYYVPIRRRAWRPNGVHSGRAVDLFSLERKGLHDAILTASADVVHAHWTYEYAMAALASGIPHLITCHDDPLVVLKFTRTFYRALRYLMARNVFRRGRNFTTVSPYMSSMLKKYTERPITVIPNPLAAEVVAQGTSRIYPHTRRIAMVCNGWDARKNAKTGIEAFAAFSKTDANAELHLFGNGYGKEGPCASWLKEVGIHAPIKMHGPTPHRELLRELCKIDLLLHTSLEESFGVILAEAMALGIPVVAGEASGAVPWVLGADEGNPAASLLCDVSNVDEVFKSIRRAFDAEYSARSEAGVRRAVSRYAPSTIAESYLSKYTAVLADGR